jgi:hypothetical protein
MAIEKNFLQLEFGSGQFFDYSKDEKEGYVKHTSTKGNVSYRKYEKDGVSGILESASIYEGKFGNQISLNIKNGDNVYYVPVDIADQKGNVDTYAESLIKVLPKLNKGDKVLVRGYNFTPEGDKYSKIGISITANGEKLKGLTNAYVDKEGNAVAGDIPGLVWKKDALGKNKPTAVTLEAKNDYLLEVLKKETERLKWVQGESSTQLTAPVASSAPKTKTAEQAFATATQVPDPVNDLPF